MHLIVACELTFERNEVMGEIAEKGVEIAAVVVPAEFGQATGATNVSVAPLCS